MTDTCTLLREYVESGSEPAFREIVTRYVDLVYSVALRRVGGNDALARDVVQSVFTDLARKASRLRADSALGGWLHRHTCFISSTLRRAEERRLARERIAVEMNRLNEPSEAAWQRLEPDLDEAIDQLGEADRQAIVLRFFERRDLRAVGAALGTNEDAAQKRLSRALEKLRAHLSNKGAALSAAALASLLAERAVKAAPAGIAGPVSLAAVSGASAAGAGFIASLITLMTSLKMQLAVGTVALGLVAGAIIYKTRSSDSLRPETAPETVATETGRQTELVGGPGNALSRLDTSPAPASAAVEAPDSDRLRLTIIAADSGRPVPGVQINYRGWEKEQFTRKQFQSTRAGICDVSVPRTTITHLELTSVTEGFADTRLDWQTDRGETIPTACTLRLVRPIPISGRVLDPDGLPVAGAKMGWNHQDDPAAMTRPESHEFGWIEVETDSDGRWRINRIAGDMLGRLYGSPSHPEYVSPPLLMVGEHREVETELREGTHVFRMGRALSLSGLVVDPEGNPVPDATVYVGGLGESGRRKSASGADGSFTVTGCRPGRNLVTAEAAGFTAGTVQVELSADTSPVRVALQRGRTLRLRVVDREGQPITGAWVWYDTLRHGRVRPGESKKPAVQVEFSPKTDEDGRAVWEGAPEGDLYFSFHKPGYMRRDDVKIPADGEEHSVTLSPALVVFGTVKDAETGEPISKFRVGCGWPSPVLGGEMQPRFSGIDRFWPAFSGGQFRHSLEESVIGGMDKNPGYIFKFEAEGYAPALSRVIDAGEGQVELDVRLDRAHDLAVSVLLPDGRPAADVEAGFLNASTELRLVPGGFSRSWNSMGSGELRRTDSQGIVKLPPDDAIVQVVAAGPAGFAQATPAALRINPALQLAAWGRIEGSFASGSQAAGRKLQLNPLRHGPGSVQFEFRAFQVQVDAQGRFVFGQVPPGRWMVARVQESKHGEVTSWSSVPLEEVEVQPGQASQLVLAANARPVSARFRLPESFQREPGARVFAVVHTPFVQPPAELREDPAALQRWSEDPYVQEQLRKMRSYPLEEGTDGVWSAEEIPAGEYILTVNLMNNAGSSAPSKSGVKAERPISIPAGDPRQTVDAGEIVLETFTVPSAP